CPLCQRPVPVNRGQDPNLAVDMHIGQGCPTPSGIAANANANTASSNLRNNSNNTSSPSLVCNVRSCSTKLLVKMDCADCGGQFCVRHRLPIDHACEPKG
ncbi:hypothetical protein BDF19DRAFT_339399, partial [Syncephalis fuscata]